MRPVPRPRASANGAQAVYLHTGDADLIVVPTTTDADLALFPAKLLDERLLEDALRGAGFELAADPCAWRGRFGVAVDLMVPEALSGGSSRRSARLPIHGNRAARRTTGLEPALVDNENHEIVAFDSADSRMVRLRVAAPRHCSSPRSRRSRRDVTSRRGTLPRTVWTCFACCRPRRPICSHNA